MRLYTFALLAALCCAHANADDQITWLSKVHDFGAFDEDTKAKVATFSFVNTTDEPVSVIAATATCGCTVPSYDERPVQPGDTATITVAYDPSGRPGRFEKQIYVRTSDSYDRTKLMIKGAVIGNPETINARYPVSMGPLKLRNGAIMLGRAYAGRDKMSYVDGYNTAHDTIAPCVVEAPEYIKVAFNPERVAPGELMSFDVTFDGAKCHQWGIITDSLKVASSAGAAAYALPVVVIVEEDFSALSPQQLKDAPVALYELDRLNIGPVADNSTTPVNGVVKLSNKGKDNLLIHRAYSEDPGLSVEVSTDCIKHGQSADIRVSYDPSVQPTGIINARVNVITNDPANPNQVIRVVAERM